MYFILKFSSSSLRWNTIQRKEEDVLGSKTLSEEGSGGHWKGSMGCIW